MTVNIDNSLGCYKVKNTFSCRTDNFVNRKNSFLYVDTLLIHLKMFELTPLPHALSKSSMLLLCEKIYDMNE